MRKLAGIAILVGIFGSLFGLGTYVVGWLSTVFVFAGVVVLFSVLGLAIYLLTSSKEDN